MPTEPAPAKINLTLHVTGKRPDGYHLLDSLVVFAGARDTIRAEAATDLTLTVGGPFGTSLSADADNLVLRAARALASAAGMRDGAALRLEKNLPVASGIGGGSADAAATMRVLARLWGVDLPGESWLALAAGLGADVPVCLDPKPRRMAGIGEVLGPAPAIPHCGLLLINPGEALATAAVFRARTGAFTPPADLPAGWPDAAAMAASLAMGRNDLQEAAVALCPAISDVLSALEAASGCLLARMSGSGATCFAVFPTPDEARHAAAALARPSWWCWGGALYDAAADT